MIWGNMDKEQELRDIISDLSSNKAKEEKDLLLFIDRLNSLYLEVGYYYIFFVVIMSKTFTPTGSKVLSNSVK